MTEALAAGPARTTDDAVLELQRESDSQHLVHLGSTGLLAAGFVAVALGGLLLPAHRPVSLVALACALAAYAVASRVEVEFPGFVAIPTEAIFVVMWFVLPLRLLPLAVCVGMILGRLPDLVRRKMPPDRLALPIASCWYSIGPALVLYAAGAHGPRWRDVPIYLAALGAQFVFDFGSTFALTRSVVPVSVLLMPMVLIVARVGREREERNDKVLELKNAYQGTSYLLGDMIEADDAYTGSHSRDVVELVLAVGERLALDADAQRMAEFTALLHDVGKLRIPNEVINKSGPLDDEERALMNTHTVLGQEMLERAGGLLGEVGPLVRSCHEHWDGNGYPDGLAGEEIPLVARIVCTCDAWNAMTTDRSYRRGLSRDEAAAELRKCAGTQFDPQVVDALVSVLDL